MDSTVTVVGNLTRDPELRFTTGGKAVVNLGLAVNRRYQVNGEWEEKVSFFNASAWGDLAENAASSLGKGSRVVVTGRLEQREYEAKDGGGTRSTVEIVADEIAPSLRWATVEITRTERNDSQGNQSSQGTRQQSTNSRGGSSGGGRRPDPVYGDEEPFLGLATEHTI